MAGEFAFLLGRSGGTAGVSGLKPFGLDAGPVADDHLVSGKIHIAAGLDGFDEQTAGVSVDGRLFLAAKGHDGVDAFMIEDRRKLGLEPGQIRKRLVRNIFFFRVGYL